MQSQNELRNLLQRIDHKSYPAYKDTRGSYDFGNYVLSIDHVQGDPFAAPSKVSVHVRGGAAKFPADLYRMKCRRLAVCDYLLRQFGRELERVSFKAKGSGKSGLLAVSRPGQEVLERTARARWMRQRAIWCFALRWDSLPTGEPSMQENWRKSFLRFFRNVYYTACFIRHWMKRRCTVRRISRRISSISGII